MGCCGCSLSASTVVASILGMIQSFLTFGVNCYYLEAFCNPDKAYIGLLNIITSMGSATKTIIGLFVVMAILNLIWFVSSLGLYIGHLKKQTLALRVWVTVTAIGLAVNFAFAFVFVFMTIETFQKAFYAEKAHAYDEFFKTLPTKKSNDPHLNSLDYTMITYNFGVFGVLGEIANIFLCVYTRRRATEIDQLNPSQPGPALVYQHLVVQGNLQNTQQAIVQLPLNENQAPTQYYSEQPAPVQYYSGQPAPPQYYSGKPAPPQYYSGKPAPPQYYSDAQASSQSDIGNQAPPPSHRFQAHSYRLNEDPPQYSESQK